MKINFVLLWRRPWLIAILLFFLILFDGCTSHRVLELLMPAIADPRETTVLSCRYDMEGERLYSAKWLKDGQEIYRYMPAQKPQVRTFPVPGIKLSTPPRCSPTSCDLELTNLTIRTSGAYRCEVSTEAPTFKIAQKTANLTVAALPQRDPLVEGAQTVYAHGEEIKVTCTSDPSLPTADVTWFINDEEATYPYVSEPSTSSPDEHGLSTRSISLNLRASRWLFRQVPQSGGGPMKELLILRCVSSMPSWLPMGPHVRQFSIAASMRPSELYNQKLKWHDSGVSIAHHSPFIVFIALALSVVFVINSRRSMIT